MLSVPKAFCWFFLHEMETGTQCKCELIMSATVAVSIVELYGLTITSVIAWSKECVIFGKRRVTPH